ncbi:RNA polymerase sporulation sigma factor SigK [Desulfallas sp. Bu1-1]|uniref:RNA polymerase sporulation sigma factor SigK n=1 Tax=Desulfallas sp. Bu1-1 TaxID=2787620 RepID=UPI0037BFE632
MLPGFWTLAVASMIHGIILLVSYVAQNSFPKPLTEEEEQYYLEKLAEGDEKARDILIERNLRLVAHIIKKFEGSGDDFDDLISIGTIGLIKAVNTFNNNKSSRLATYASKCIENEILMYMRSKKKMRAEMSLYEPIGTDKEGNEIHFMDVLSTDAEAVSEMVSRIMDKEQLWRKLKKLTPQERKVLVLRFGLRGKERKTQKEIAKKLGISRSYVSRIEKRAIDRLSEQFLAEA